MKTYWLAAAAAAALLASGAAPLSEAWAKPHHAPAKSKTPAPAAAPPVGHQRLIASLHEVSDKVAGLVVRHDSPRGHFEVEFFAHGSVAKVRATVATVPCPELLLRPVLFERVNVVYGPQVDAPAAPAIAAIGTTLRNEFLAVKAGETMAPRSPANLNSDAI